MIPWLGYINIIGASPSVSRVPLVTASGLLCPSARVPIQTTASRQRVQVVTSGIEVYSAAPTLWTVTQILVTESSGVRLQSTWSRTLAHMRPLDRWLATE